MTNIRNVTLETVCGITSRLPENAFFEVAFAGKSNVGKSSLINALIQRKALARTSSEPGKTQTINYYRTAYRPEEGEDGEAYLVDLPGYGYARTSEETRRKWGQMIDRYLHTSKQLKAVFLLVDIRHAPSANDVQMFDWIRSCGFPPIVIATKLDKIKRSQQQAQVRLIRQTLNMRDEERLICFSAETKQGREEIWEQILAQR